MHMKQLCDEYINYELTIMKRLNCTNNTTNNGVGCRHLTIQNRILFYYARSLQTNTMTTLWCYVYRGAAIQCHDTILQRVCFFEKTDTILQHRKLQSFDRFYFCVFLSTFWEGYRSIISNVQRYRANSYSSFFMRGQKLFKMLRSFLFFICTKVKNVLYKKPASPAQTDAGKTSGIGNYFFDFPNLEHF